ncbi:MAG: uroporphyrinogen-III synthase [Bacteroidota bacterium]
MGLENKTILITRQREQSVEFIAEIEKRGGKAILLPMINIQDPDSWDECDRALQHIRTYGALIFTSANSVEKFFQRCLLKSIEPVVLRRYDVYAVGEKTKQAVEERGLSVRAIPDEFSSTGLAEYFKTKNVRGRRFLYPRGDLGKSDLIKSLVQQGANVDPVVVYKNTGPDEVDAEIVYRRLVAGEVDVITFASPSAATNFVRLFPLERMALMDKRTKIAVIGPTTEEAVKNLGVRVDIVARRSTIEGLINAIEEYYAQ